MVAEIVRNSAAMANTAECLDSVLVGDRFSPNDLGTEPAVQGVASPSQNAPAPLVAVRQVEDQREDPDGRGDHAEHDERDLSPVLR